MIQIGLRAHDFGSSTPEQLARTLAAYNPASIQLALTKAISGTPKTGGFLSTGYARKLRAAFEKHNIAISVLGCYINPVHPDAHEREKALLRFEEHVRYVRDFGCSLVATETGSCNADCSFHPDTAKPQTFDLFCTSIERLVVTAEKCGSIVALEAVADQHTISTPELIRKLLERIPSPALQVIYDPVNLIPQNGLSETQEAFFMRAFDSFGNRIAAVHAKDFIIQNGKKSGAIPAGTGELDYRLFLRLLRERKPNIDVLLENANPATARETMSHLYGLMEPLINT